jgi:hypothetical protein
LDTGPTLVPGGLARFASTGVNYYKTDDPTRNSYFAQEYASGSVAEQDA